MKPEEIFKTFTEKIAVVVDKRKSLYIEWLAPVATEVERQMKFKSFHQGKLASAISVAKTKTGYHSDFQPALQWLSKNWPYGATLVISSSSSTTFRTGSNIGQRWLAQRKEEEEKKEKELEKKRTTTVTTGRKKGQSLENAYKALGFSKVSAWDSYFKSLVKTPNLASKKKDPTTKSEFEAAISSAKKHIDPLLKGRVIVNDNLLKAKHSLMQSSQTDEAHINTILRHYGLHKPSESAHWFAKGLIIDRIKRIKIRCDGSAALAFYKLYHAGDFTCHLGIIGQGDPSSVGHWFVIAGVKDRLAPKNKGLRKKTFVVDLWGASITSRKSAVVYPSDTIGMTGGKLRLVCSV